MLARSKWMMAGIAALTAAVIWAVAAPAAQASAAEADTPPAVSATSPSAAEVEALQYMREEEKLARDVYLALYEEWQLPIFQTIVYSESQHMEAMLTLIEKYGLTDPAAGKVEGEFTRIRNCKRSMRNLSPRGASRRSMRLRSAPPSKTWTSPI